MNVMSGSKQWVSQKICLCIKYIWNITKGIAFERKVFIIAVLESWRIDAKVHFVLSTKENMKGASGYVKGASGYMKAKRSSATVTAQFMCCSTVHPLKMH